MERRTNSARLGETGGGSSKTERSQFVDRAVSPVIGVILMVAITVILSAVIGTFVLNLGGSVEQNVQAGATVSQTSDNRVQVTWTATQNAEELHISMSGCITESTTLADIGSHTTSATCNSGTVTVIVVAHGQGDAKSVIINKDLEF